jgi:hypothetical protein
MEIKEILTTDFTDDTDWRKKNQGFTMNFCPSGIPTTVSAKLLALSRL